MAKIHGIPGEWARVKGMVAGLWPLFLGVFIGGVALALVFFWMIVGIALFVVDLIFVIWSLVAGLRHVERFFKGARGEEKVSGVLGRLPDAYHIFNDFTSGRHHVDHVVVGPGGVFAIETKFWQGRVTVEDGCVLLDGQLPNRSPLAQVTREARIVAETLGKLGWKGVVTPVLVFASDTFAAHRADLNGTVVINSNELKESFDTDRVVISPAELGRLVGLMESNS